MLHHRLLLAAALGIIACSSSTGPNGTVLARSTASGIEATNRTDRPVFYKAVERGTLALYDFAPCIDATRCPTIPPGGSTVVAWAQVVGFSTDRHEYVVLWWQAPRSGTQLDMRSIVVTR